MIQNNLYKSAASGMNLEDSFNASNIADTVIKSQAEQDNFEGLASYNPNTTSQTYYNPQDPASIKARREVAMAQNNGLSFRPPSNGQMLFDMLGGLLIGYGASRLLGADSNAGLAVGLQAAGINHDKDKEESQRYEVIQNAIARNGMIYDPSELWDFMKTGNGKGMEQAEQRHYNTMSAEERYTQQDKNREDTQRFQGEQQDANRAQREAFHSDQMNMQKDRLEHGGMNGNLVDENGFLTFHGGNQATGLANAVRQSKAPFVRSMQSRNAKLVSAENMKETIKQNIANGDYMTAQTNLQTLKDDLAGANKGGNASIGAEDRKDLDNIGSLLNQMENKARKTAGYTPNEETMNAMFNNLDSITKNDRAGLNQEVQNEVSNLGGGVYNPTVVKGAASIILNQRIGDNGVFTNPVAPDAQEVNSQAPAADGSKQVQASNRELLQADGQASNSPEGAAISNGRVTLKVVNGKWEVQD